MNLSKNFFQIYQSESESENNNFQKQAPEVYYKKGVLKNFAKFTEKHLCQSLFFKLNCKSKVCNFIKKDTLAQMFSCDFFARFLRTLFFIEHLLLLPLIF